MTPAIYVPSHLKRLISTSCFAARSLSRYKYELDSKDGVEELVPRVEVLTPTILIFTRAIAQCRAEYLNGKVVLDKVVSHFISKGLPSVFWTSIRGLHTCTVSFQYEPEFSRWDAGSEYAEFLASSLPEVLRPYRVDQAHTRFLPKHNGHGDGTVLVPIAWDERDLRPPLP